MPSPPGHPQLPSGYRLRRPSLDDAAAVAELQRAVEVHLHGETDATVDEVRELWTLPRLSLRDDAWLAIAPGGALAGSALTWHKTPGAELVALLFVHPAHRDCGLGDALLDRCERRAERLAGDPPRSAGVVLALPVPEADAAQLELVARRGYAHVRTFLRLTRDLTEPVAPPVWPAGIEVRPFRKGRDEAAVHGAIQEAFRDHFRPAEMELDEWVHSRLARDDLDPGLWPVAHAGDEVAGAALSFVTPSGGYIDELFVRRPWRGQGLGRALLRESCIELRRRGLSLAYLGVDAENPTGAVALYESEGFTSMGRTRCLFEKRLREC